MATSTGTCKSKLKQGVAEDWASVGRAYGLNSDTIKVLKRKSSVLELSEDDLKTLPIPAEQRRLLYDMLKDLKTTRELAARHGNKKLSAELRRAFPQDKYTVEAHCLEEEGGSEVLEAVTVSTTDNIQDEVLIYCKPYNVALKAGTLDFDETGDELFDFVGEAMEMMDAGNYKGTLLLLPEQTFLPRYLAETLQQKGQIFTLRHTDGFVSVVREEVDKLLEDEEEEDEDEEHDETLRSTPRGQAYLLEVSPGELVLITGDEDLRAYGLDKEDPTRTPQTESGVSGARSKPKVNRKLYPELPTQDGSQDTISTGSSEGRRETEPKKKEATRDVLPKDQTPQVSPSSRHPTKDPTPDRSRSKEASKASSGSATTTSVSSGVHVKKDGTPDMRYKENKEAAGLYGLKMGGTPDMRFKEHKIAAGLHGQKKDGTPDRRFKESSEGYDSVLAYTASTETTSFLSQQDTWADERPSPPSSPYVSKENDGYGGGLFTSGFEGSYPVGPLKKDGTPDMRYKVNKMAAGLYGLKKDGTPDMRFKENRTSYGSSSYSPSYLSGYSSGYSPSYSSGYSSGYSPSYSSGYSSGYSPSYSSGYSSGYSPSYSPSYSAGPLKKDGTPDMRYKANKIAAGLYGMKMDGTPDMRFKANRRR